MRLSAYVLAGDDVHLVRSLRSYYDYVDKIYYCFDEESLSWLGHPLHVESGLQLIKTIDTDRKVVLLPGRFSSAERAPLESETLQRQYALDAASTEADWVLQLDSDEVLPRPAALISAITAAEMHECTGVDFPARWLYAVLGRGRTLESSTRWWAPAMSYPGPLAVKSGSRLRHCRQAEVDLFRVDVRQKNSDPFRSSDTPVHQVIELASAALHYSWARPIDSLRQKARINGHVNDWDWGKAIDRWEWSNKHPLMAAAATPYRRAPSARWLRLGRIDRDLVPDSAG